MKKAGKLPRTTRWAAALWERRYRGVTIWVEEMYARSLKWEWTAESGDSGRSKSKAGAMRAAQRFVDRGFA